MRPAFAPGERLLVSTNAYKKVRPSRGDVVVFKDPREPARRSLKRVVGLPDEEIRLSDGMLFVDGEHHLEPYLQGLPATVGLDHQSWRLGEDEYFAMGDNRAHSTDSRHFGPLAPELIIGKTWFRCWPLSRWGSIS